jgi:hypothetical protein
MIPLLIKVAIAYIVNTDIEPQNGFLNFTLFIRQKIAVSTIATKLPKDNRFPNERANSVAEPAYIIIQKR